MNQKIKFIKLKFIDTYSVHVYKYTEFEYFLLNMIIFFFEYNYILFWFQENIFIITLYVDMLAWSQVW